MTEPIKITGKLTSGGACALATARECRKNARDLRRRAERCTLQGAGVDPQSSYRRYTALCHEMMNARAFLEEDYAAQFVRLAEETSRVSGQRIQAEEK